MKKSMFNVFGKRERIDECRSWLNRFFCKKRDFQKNCRIQVQNGEKCDIL